MGILGYSHYSRVGHKFQPGLCYSLVHAVSLNTGNGRSILNVAVFRRLPREYCLCSFLKWGYMGLLQITSFLIYHKLRMATWGMGKDLVVVGITLHYIWGKTGLWKVKV